MAHALRGARGFDPNRVFLPIQALVAKEVAVPKDAPEEEWFGLDPDLLIEPLSVAEASSRGKQTSATCELVGI